MYRWVQVPTNTTKNIKILRLSFFLFACFDKCLNAHYSYRESRKKSMYLHLCAPGQYIHEHNQIGTFPLRSRRKVTFINPSYSKESKSWGVSSVCKIHNQSLRWRRTVLRTAHKVKRYANFNLANKCFSAPSKFPKQLHRSKLKIRSLQNIVCSIIHGRVLARQMKLKFNSRPNDDRPSPNEVLFVLLEKQASFVPTLLVLLLLIWLPGLLLVLIVV